MHPVSCTNTHHDVTDLVNHGMVKNTKALISQERYITFLWNKKILDLYLRWHILRSYFYVVEVTLKWKKYLQNFQTFLSWMLDLLLKLFLLTSMWLQVPTWVCMKSWLYGPLMSSTSPVHLDYSFKIGLRTKLFYCWSLNNFESSLILQFFKCYKTKPLQIWSLPPSKTTLLAKNFVLQVITVFRSSHQSFTVKKFH